MPLPVSLRDIVHEMAEIADDRSAFLNRRTGELVTLNDHQRAVLENGHPTARDDERTLEVREVYEAGDLLELPTKFEHREYSIVESFCHAARPLDHKEQLLKAIRGKRAFRDFHAVLRRLGIEQKWRGHRDRALEQIAVSWLDHNGIPYMREAA